MKWAQLSGSLNFLCIAFLWDWNENWTFPVLWPQLSFPNLLAYWVQHFNSISFRIWNRSAGILSPSLPLFIVMLPEAHLTSHSMLNGSRWVITSSWLSWPLRPFLYSSSVNYLIITSIPRICIPGISSPQLQGLTLLRHCWSWFGSILLKNSATIFRILASIKIF